MFVVYNTFLGSLIIDNKLLNFSLTALTWIIVLIAIVQTSFVFEEMSYHAVMILVITFIYTLILIPSFVWVTNTIYTETMNEAKASYVERDNFRRMFDALQEGIIVI